MEKTMELIEQSNNKEEFLNLKKNIIYKNVLDNNDCESFESDGKSIYG